MGQTISNAQKCQFGVNGIAMDCHGLILRENKAMGARKVFEYLPGPWAAHGFSR